MNKIIKRYLSMSLVVMTVITTVLAVAPYKTHAAGISVTKVQDVNDDSSANWTSQKFTLSNGNVAFCSQHSKDTPKVGDILSEPTIVKDDTIRKILYYGNGGPGDTGQVSFTRTTLCLSNANDDSFGIAGSEVTASVLDYFKGLASPPSSFTVYKVTHGNDSYQDLMYGVYKPQGELKIKKTSANTTITNGNNCYDLAGAVYGVYDKSGALVTKITTDAKGEGSTILDEGSYTVKEITPPKGYALDTSAQNAIINSGKAISVNVSDNPLNDPVGLMMKKVDAESGENISQGTVSSLGGAQFRVKYYDTTDAEKVANRKPLKTWIFETDEDGFIFLFDEYYVDGDDLYRNASGELIFPIGIMTYQEIKAPKGYELNDQVFTVILTGDSNTEIVTYNEPTIPDQIIKRDISVIKTSTDESTTDDNSYYNFEGAVYGLFNAATGGEVTRITLDKNGKGTFKDVVYDNYYIQEISAPTGYLVNSTKYDISDADFDANESVILCDVSDNPQYGKIDLTKVDSETGKSEGQSAAVIEGAVYQIKNAAGKVVDTLTIGEDGKATSKILPLGKYFINEISASDGYLLDESTHIADIKSTDSTTKVLVSSQVSKEQIKRGDLELIKVSDGDMLRLADIPFKITALSITNEDYPEGESHIIVTDKNGRASTEGDWNKHSYNTNRGESSEDGVWFGEISSLDDSKGALPYGDYMVEEMRCDANAKYDLIPPFKITVTRDGYTIDLGTLTNDYTYVEEPTPIEISTTATFGDGSKTTVADGEVTIFDSVSMTGLTVGNKYKLVGWEMDKVKNTKFLVNDEEISNELEFEATATDMVVEMEFTFNASGLGDTELVTYEEVYDITDKENTELVAEHKDIDDEGQTVQLKAPTPDELTEPNKIEISTTATFSDGSKTTVADGEVTIVDSVTMTGLTVGNIYKLVGWEMDKVENIKFLVNGEEISNELEFEATATDMVVEMEFTFDASGLGDTELVTYEEVYDITDKENTELVAEHKDIDDEGQTVQLKVPTTDENTSEENKTGDTELPSNLLKDVKTGDKIFVIVLLCVIGVGGVIAFFLGKKKNK